ncbi:MAG TPA: fumarylacetoacetate hydrolase family protein [Bacteroidota bacterium]|nr:fumarylacetoacetate hydrolase family protein [Bacteroidota bacterium]
MATATLQGTPTPLTIPKIICVGRNYAEHAKEMKADVPTTPVLFLKPPTAVVHNHGSVVIPPVSRELHHEVEMTVLIGKGGKNISREKAMEHIAGYGIGLDMTLRDLQSDAKKKGLPWSVAKGFDTSAPLSDFVPAASVANPHQLTVELTVNGSARQKGSTSDFIFKLDQLVSSISQIFTLEPGDVIFTGTPEGVAQAVAGDTLLGRLLEPSGKVLATIMAHVEEA